MLLEVIETFKKLSDGQILRPGDTLELPGEKALQLIARGRVQPISPESPSKKGTPPPPQFSVGQCVRFSHLRALDVLEGVVLESKWHPAPLNRWWYRIEAGGLKIWTSESHVQAVPGGSGPTNKGEKMKIAQTKPKPTDRKDLVEHFAKDKKTYTGPRPFSGIGLADRPPLPSWRESLGRFLTNQLSVRPSIRWEMAWSGAPTQELNDLINALCERSVIRLERHQSPGHAAFWTISRGLNFHPDKIKEALNA